ncbi:MAG: thioredoxin domain-containing protein [Sphingomicrobium sp.]
MKPSYFLASAVALVAIAGCNSNPGDAATGNSVKLEQVAPPKGGDWSQVYNVTEAGGMLMGNPEAKVRLIEYGSLTCPHCREFDEKGVPQLIDKYVKSGQVAWEFRNYVRDAVDLTATLIARCNGAKIFFPLTRALYTDQEQWIGRIQEIPADQLAKLQELPPNQQFLQLAKSSGLQDFAAARGIPMAKSGQCLSDENAVNQLVQMTADVTNQFPNFPGTPSFVLGDKLLDKTATWEALEPQLKAAVGG